MAHGLEAIDWAAPWMQPWQAVGQGIAQRLCTCTGMGVDEALNQAMQEPARTGMRDVPVRFVPQSHLPSGVAYESYIFQTRQCPTRPGLHDFFNGLVWLHLPRTKAHLNRMQAQAIASAGIGGQRGWLRDTITVLDESAALMQAPDKLWEALCQRRWLDVFGTLRPLWAQTRVLIFGHAVLEKLVHPYPSITAQVWRVDSDLDWPLDCTEQGQHAFTVLDDWLSTALSPARLMQKPCTALPVLGIPDWYPANASPHFYQNEKIFRPPRINHKLDH